MPASKILRARGRDVLRARQRVVRRGDPEAIHDLRVATRRLQATLEVFASGLAEGPCRRLDRRARRIRRCLGARRNAFVLLELVGEIRASVDRDALSFVDDLAERLRRSTPARGMGPSRTFPGIRKRLQAVLRSLRSRRTGSASPRDAALDRPLQGVLRARTTARGADPESMHRARIAVKRYRYTLEVLAEAGTPGLEKPLRDARDLQREMGRLHDLDVLIDTVRRVVHRPGGPVFLRSLLRLRDRQADTALRRLAAFRPARLGARRTATARAPGIGRTAA
jgi:CHAD domain-containing protein